MVADRHIAECQDVQWDVIALPGGMPGAEHLRDNEMLTKLLQDPENGPFRQRNASWTPRFPMVFA